MSFAEYLRERHASNERSTEFDEETKQKIFDNAGGLCERCGKRLVRENRDVDEDGAWHAHHVLPQEYGGNGSVENGAALCWDCHYIVHHIKGELERFISKLLRKREYSENDIRVLLNKIRQKKANLIKKGDSR